MIRDPDPDQVDRDALADARLARDAEREPRPRRAGGAAELLIRRRRMRAAAMLDLVRRAHDGEDA